MPFLGKKLQITSAYQSGCFEDVPIGSDLFSSISLFDPRTKMAGQLSASRISSGTGDLVHLEIYGKKGALRYSSHTADYFEYYMEESKQWIKKVVGSNYFSITGFPSGHVSPGWLRAMVHAHYIFLSGDDPQAFVPDLKHGLAVQRIVRETASHLQEFRNKNYED